MNKDQQKVMRKHIDLHRSKIMTSQYFDEWIWRTRNEIEKTPNNEGPIYVETGMPAESRCRILHQLAEILERESRRLLMEAEAMPLLPNEIKNVD